MDITTNFLSRSLSEIASSVSDASGDFSSTSTNYEFEQKLRQLIEHAFCPNVFTLCSDDTETFIKGKGFKNFASFIRSFGDRVERKKSNNPNTSAQHANSQSGRLREDTSSIRFLPMSAVRTPQQWHRDRAWNKENEIELEQEMSYEFAPGGNMEHIRELFEKNIKKWAAEVDDQVEPDSFLDPMLQYFKFLMSGNPIAQQETFSHPVGCLIVLTSHNPHPLATIMRLYKEVNNANFPRFMSREMLHYYLYIHDEDEHDLETSLQVFGNIQRSIGANSKFIRLRSRYIDLAHIQNRQSPSNSEYNRDELKGEGDLYNPSSLLSSASLVNSFSSPTLFSFDSELAKVPEPTWKSPLEILKEEDEEKGSSLKPVIPSEEIQEMESLVTTILFEGIRPFMQRCVNSWEESTVTHYGGFTGKLFSASKKYLGKNHSSSAQGNYDSDYFMYSADKPEAVKRRMADFLFMLREYKRAYEIYDELRKTFCQERAWNYLASCLEAQIICLLMQNRAITPKLRTSVLDKIFNDMVLVYAARLHSLYYTSRSIVIGSLLLATRPGNCIDDAVHWFQRLTNLNVIPLSKFEYAFFITCLAGLFTVRASLPSLDKVINGRERKAAFWFLHSIKNWLDCDHPKMALVCWKFASCIYEDSCWSVLSTHIKAIGAELSSTANDKN
ncbi:TRAPP complex subunit Trs85 [Schizosaccharomyces octosporus yFS286]|uniref:TRAPP complex subunit Trs85 n=1 Tax=Schizosaccharomyces octosporus (strain yFS286) TaxID=483514 RepID=S9PT91_SCHOY|nr:TRAPP complex subunit Trs85 [Schizosaccharomyces octosporus yFS286]EPX71187.1 TRAPP complex subunit Trs85 [Schizosaccharomyces octosporus yFS286]